MDYKRILWTSLVILAAGIFLLCYKQPSLDLCVTILGGVLTASAVVNLGMQFAYSRQSKVDGSKHSLSSIWGSMAAIASGCLGIWMIINPAGFTTAMVYIFGGLMIIGGLFLIYDMVFVFKPVKFPFGFYILPTLVTICGIVMCVLSPETTKNIIITIVAIAMIVFSIGAIIVVSGLSSYNRTLRETEKAAQKAAEEAAKEAAKAAAEPSQPEIPEDTTYTDVSDTPTQE